MITSFEWRFLGDFWRSHKSEPDSWSWRSQNVHWNGCSRPSDLRESDLRSQHRIVILNPSCCKLSASFNTRGSGLKELDKSITTSGILATSRLFPPYYINIETAVIYAKTNSLEEILSRHIRNSGDYINNLFSCVPIPKYTHRWVINRKSMAQSKATIFLAVVTKRFPGPTILLTRGTLFVP